MTRKIVLITGAVKNTGYAIAVKFASEGYDVAVTSRDLSAATETAGQIAKAYGVRARGYALDLTDTDDIKRVFGSVKEELGALSVFIANSANLGVDIKLTEATPEQFDDVMLVNLRGTYFCCQQAAIQMSEQRKGAIVIIGSVHYKQAIVGRSLYAVSKGGLASLVRSMAYELGEYGIRANYIVAGAIRTERWDTLSAGQIEEKRKNWPVGKESTGEDIANAAYYLGSELSATVSGIDLTVDSGIGICLLPYKDR